MQMSDRQLDTFYVSNWTGFLPLLLRLKLIIIIAGMSAQLKRLLIVQYEYGKWTMAHRLLRKLIGHTLGGRYLGILMCQ